MKSRHRNRLLHAGIPVLIVVTLLLSVLTSVPLLAQAASQPQMTLDPGWGYFDTPVRIHGIDFSPNSQVRISWATLNFWEIYTTTGLTTGIFDLITNVPDGLKAGDYVVTATDANGKTASANFTLYSVFQDAGVLGIRSSKQLVKFNITSTSFFCDTWKFFHNSQNDWYNIMVQDYGIYILRLTYNGTTYVFDLAGGAFNAWPVPLKEKVSGFAITGTDCIQGKVAISDPTGTVLLATILVDIRAPKAADDYYSLVFNLTSEAKLDDLAFYVAYNLNMYQPPNSALYDKESDAVYQYYGPSHYGFNIPAQYLAVAGFGSVVPASSKHDVDIDYSKVLSVANKLGDSDFDYTCKDEVHGDAFGNCAVGLQWILGAMNSKASVTIPVVFASSDTTVESFKNNIAEGKSKLLADQTILPAAKITLTKTEGPGTSIVGISGQGFMPYATVSVDFAGVSVSSFMTSNTGMFSGNFVVPTAIKGNYTVTAKDGYGLKATTDFTVSELTLQWLIDKLDSMNATITGLVKDVNGTLSVLINTNSGNILAKLSDVNASLTSLIVDERGNILARIDTAVGQINAKVDDIDARLVGIIGNATGAVLARIDSKVGETLVKVDQINATLVGIIGNATGDVLARIDSKVGETLVKVDSIQAKLIGIVGDAAGDILARIDSKVGETLVKVDQINATLVGIIGNATGDVLARIDSRVGEIQVKVSQINATLVGIIGDAKGDVLARIDSKVGETLVKVNQINATLVEIIGNAKGDVLARIDSRVGEILVKVDQINATITGIVGNAKGDVLARIDTKVGDALVKLDTINGALSSVSGNMATIQTTLGSIQVSLSDLNTKVTKIEGDVATVETSLGTLTGKVTKMEGDIATIETDIGTLKTDTRLVRSDFSLQPIVIAAVIEVAAISGIVYTIWAYRKREIAKKELVIAEASSN